MVADLAIRVHGITKAYGDVVALDRVDLDVPKGQIHGLAGPNGAGKTTLLGLLLGLAVADSGRLEILGTPVRRALAAPDAVAGFVDGPGLYPSLTARQNLAALAALHGRNVRTAGIDDVLAEVGLTDVADDRVRGFSLGMRQRLGLATALLTNPRVLVLDEPSNGLDPAGKKHVYGVLSRLAADGATVMLSSHRMDDLEALCHEVTILAVGRVVFPDGIQMFDDAGIRPDRELLVVRGLVPALDELVRRLVHAGIAVRELAPVVSPLETAFLALAEQQESE